jgi:8-oxo-dGTP pyrophosphatase MutT (NUDIX family)
MDNSSTKPQRSYASSPSVAKYAVSPATFLQTLRADIANIAASGYIFNSTGSNCTILLLRRSASEAAFPNLWEPPGGGVDLTDATVLDGVVREVFEETGLIVRKIDSILSERELPERFGRNWHKVDFLVEVESGEVKIDPEEHSEWKWVGLDEISGLQMTSVEVAASVKEAFAKVTTSSLL